MCRCDVPLTPVRQTTGTPGRVGSCPMGSTAKGCQKEVPPRLGWGQGELAKPLCWSDRSASGPNSEPQLLSGGRGTPRDHQEGSRAAVRPRLGQEARRGSRPAAALPGLRLTLTHSPAPWPLHCSRQELKWQLRRGGGGARAGRGSVPCPHRCPLPCPWSHSAWLPLEGQLPTRQPSSLGRIRACLGCWATGGAGLGDHRTPGSSLLPGLHSAPLGGAVGLGLWS